MESGRKVTENGQEQDDKIEVDGATFWNAGAIWNLERYVYQDDQESQYVSNSPDRTWVIRTDARTADQGSYAEIVPFGWTDRQHPIGPGHFFYGLPVANQKPHWTWQQSIDQILAPGNNSSIASAANFPTDWLKNLGSDSVLAVFSVEASAIADLEAINVSTGPYQIASDGTFRVKLFNHSSIDIPRGWLTLVAHFELYKEMDGW